MDKFVRRMPGWIAASMVLLHACSNLRPTPTRLPFEDQDAGWAPRASMITARSEMPAAVLNGLIYIAGGFGGERAFEVYDPASDSWQSLAPLPEGRHHLMSVASEGKIFVFGGARSLIDWTPTATAWAYDPRTDTWSDLAMMPEARMAGAAVALDGAIYVLGGSGDSDALLRYDPPTDQWESLAALGKSREHLSAAVLDGLILAIGGRWSGQGEFDTVEIYDPQQGGWTAGPSMQTARAGFGAAVLDGTLYVAGGEILTRPRITLDSVEMLDSPTGTWSSGTRLPVPLHGVPLAASQGAVYILGGSGRAGAIDNQGFVFIFQP